MSQPQLALAGFFIPMGIRSFASMLPGSASSCDDDDDFILCGVLRANLYRENIDVYIYCRTGMDLVQLLPHLLKNPVVLATQSHINLALLRISYQFGIALEYRASSVMSYHLG